MLTTSMRRQIPRKGGPKKGGGRQRVSRVTRCMSLIAAQDLFRFLRLFLVFASTSSTPYNTKQATTQLPAAGKRPR